MSPLSSGANILKAGGVILSAPITPTPIETPTILLTFDDVRSTHYTVAFPYMANHSMLGTLYAITDSVDDPGKLTAAQLIEMYAAGWDIANHTSDHSDLTTLTQAQVETKLTDAQTWLDSQGFTRSSKHVAYPFGAVNATVRAAMAVTGMLTGRSTVEALETSPPSDIYGIDAYALDTNRTLAQAKSLVDNAISQNGVLIVYMHGLLETPVNEFDWSTADFEAFIDYVAAQGLPAITMNEYFEGVYA